VRILIFCLGILTGLLLTFNGCNRSPERVEEASPVEYVQPHAQQGKPTIALGDVHEEVVVKRILVPKIVTETTQVTRYVRRDSLIYVSATVDSSGLMLDSLRIPNTKSIRFADDGHGGATVSVTNTSPFFSTANVTGEYFRPKQFNRVAPVLFGGVVYTPAGVQPAVGIGFGINLRKRR